MSEYNTLYVSVQIAADSLQRFFQERPNLHSLSGPWLEWWQTREMYGKRDLDRIPAYNTPTRRAVFDQLLNDPRNGCLERYDSTRAQWIFAVLFFSENYTEIIPMLALLHDLAAYQATSDTGLAILYDFYWDNRTVMAYLSFYDQQAVLQPYQLLLEVDPAVLAPIERDLTRAIEILRQQNEQ
ncbi:hypothetical protein ACFSBF_20830 [Sphingobacterium suaedae]|uniref:Uncharacterized protein n=2 Tax=Sphingobacterium suaedae TaxID=1686402 RepID=A0ABW5KL27_9SPHI